MIDIMSISGEVLLSVPVAKEAVVREELMANDYIRLSWSSDRGDVLPIGCYVEYLGERYSLLNPYTPTRANEVEYKYTPQFQSRVVRWQKTIVPIYTYESDGKTVKSRELDWTFTGTPDNAMYIIQQAILNETGEHWNYSVDDELPETITISSQASSIWTLLSDIAEQCDTEWWTQKNANWLYLSRCSHGASITLEVGKNVKVPSVISSSGEHHTRFYAFGSTRNITQEDRVSNGSIVNKRLTLDPVKYPHGYKDIKGHFEKGVFVSDLKKEEIFPTPLYFEEIYPSSNLIISNVRKRIRYRLDENGNKVVTGGSSLAPTYETYAIWYFQIPNFTFSEELIIEGLELSAHFRTGQLRGREFALAYHKTAKKVADIADVDNEFAVKAGEYEIIFDEQTEGFIIPSEDYIIPANGDGVTLFNIKMPSEYTSSAYAELESELDKEIERRSKDNNSYEFDSNPVAFYETGEDISLGQKVVFINNGTTLESRVLMVEKKLDYGFEQKIRIGNEIIRGSRQQLKDEVREVGKDVSVMKQLSELSSATQRDHERELMLTMGRYLAMKDTIDMLQGAVEGFTEGINPITVETMALLVGNESLQFRFTNSREDLAPITCPIVYDSVARQLNATECALIHLTLDIDAVTPMNVKKASDYRSWDMSEWHSEILEDVTKRFYVYAKVSTNGTGGIFILSETAIGMRSVDGYYHLLAGILNSEYGGVREFLPLYGFTQILPGQISTDVLRDANGNLEIDLLNATITAKDRATIIAKNGAKIIGDVEFGSGSTGLNNLPEWKDIENSATPLNLLADSAELVLDAGNNNNAYKVYGFPITVSTGDAFMFKCESSELLSGVGDHYYIRLFNLALNRSFAISYIQYGENKAQGLWVDTEGVSNEKCVFVVYAGNPNNTAGNKIRLNNFSLVKGKTPMPMWQDYQGDNGLKNLLSVGETFEGQNTSYTYYGEELPITVNAGEKYTFHIENISMLSGTDSNGTYYCYLDDLNNNWLSDTASGYINQSGFGTFTIREGVSNAKARFLVSKNETSQNSATVRIKRMSLVKGTRPMMSWKPNTDYLTNAFKNGTTKISGGLVMAQAVAVTNNAGTVKGMFNGSETFKHAEHGTLMLAAGSEGSSAAQLLAAKTRIFEDGHLASKSATIEGEIKATSGTIGNFSIKNGGISIDTTTIPGYLELNEQGMRFGGTGKGTAMGSCSVPLEAYDGGVMFCPAEGDSRHIAFMVSSQQIAICCPSGMYQGLRPMTRDIIDGTTLEESDHNVFIDSGTIYLPATAGAKISTGQTYKIYHYTSGTTVTIQGNGKNIIRLRGAEGSVSDTKVVSTNPEVIELLYGGSNWYATINMW